MAHRHDGTDDYPRDLRQERSAHDRDSVFDVWHEMFSREREAYFLDSPAMDFCTFVRSQTGDAFRFFAEHEEVTAREPLAPHERRAPFQPCLLDLVYAWIRFGEGTQVCPSFEVYLLTVLDIISKVDTDYYGDQTEEGRGRIEGIKLWDISMVGRDTDPADNPPRGSIPICCDDHAYAGSVGLIPSSVRPSWLNHPALNRTNYEIAKAMMLHRPRDQQPDPTYGSWHVKDH